MSQSVPPVGVPVGTIVAYAGELAALLEAEEWALCNGNQFTKDKNPDLFAAIGYANGGHGNFFNVPDLQGRFMRGRDPGQDRTPGLLMPWKTGPPARPMKVTVKMMATDWHYTNKGGEAETRVIDWYDNTAQLTNVKSDAETRPINVALYWIIKVKPFDGEGDDIPLGGVIPFAGGDKQSPANAGASYIRCDGQPVLEEDVEDLATAVGTRFQLGSGTTSWWPPNLTGKFIRGVDLSGRNDPDSGSRLYAPGGQTTGVGTWQRSATALKGASVSVPYYSKRWHRVHEYKPGPNNRVIQDATYTSAQEWQGGDRESRPVNAAVHYYINSVNAKTTKSDLRRLPAIFPIGGIIAIPGTPNPGLNANNWLECDGRAIPQSTWPKLFDAIGYTWGKPASQTGTFNLPNILGWFLRGADVSGAQDGDPDWDTRFSLQNGGASRGPGSYQKSATMRPAQLNIEAFDYPVDTVTTAKTTSMSGGSNKSAQASGQRTLDLTAKWDDETIPTTVVVRYYIRAA